MVVPCEFISGELNVHRIRFRMFPLTDYSLSLSLYLSLHNLAQINMPGPSTH